VEGTSFLFLKTFFNPCIVNTLRGVFYCKFVIGKLDAGFGDRFQAESGWNCSSILTLLGSGHQKTVWNSPVPNVQQRTPDDGQRRCPKHV